MNQARAAPHEVTAELAVNQEWVDVSVDPPDPDPPPREPWWRRGPAARLMAQWVPGVAVDAGRGRLMAMMLVGGLVLAVLIAIGVAVSSSGTEYEPPPVLPVAAASESIADTTEKEIVVSVVGRVASPGLVTLAEGARVADALREAGGPAAGTDLGALNLARRLADGEQIYVGVPAPPGTEPIGAPAGQPGVADQVDLNSASLTALDTLPGVGPVTAQRILDWRTEHGRFDSVNQLREIDGIGPSRFAKLKEHVVAR
jgi:competence protein ComEA